MIFNFFSFLISMVFIGYSTTMVYFFWTRNRNDDFILSLTLGLFGSFLGGLTEVFVFRPLFYQPGYFFGFQYIFPLSFSAAVIVILGLLRRIKEN